MLSYIAIILSSISIFLLMIVLIKFNKKYSNDAISKKIEKKVEFFITDLNRNANRDLELLKESSKRARMIINEADQKMEDFKEATQRLRDMIAEVDKITVAKNNESIIYNKNLENIKPVGYEETKVPNIDPDASYKINKIQQGSLFEEENPKEYESILKDETKVMPDGAAYKEVPLIITKVFDDKTISEKSQKSLKERAEKLFYQGMQINDIAAELSCSISEIQFIIDML